MTRVLHTKRDYFLFDDHLDILFYNMNIVNFVIKSFDS